ncbi:MAG TPA: Stk1 family PASTA domain-containing Ser/Thr kinase [Bacilli bacterium]
MIGQELGGRYEIIERIGEGGMALVYKALDILLNRKVAIKILRNQYVNDEEFIRRFRREAQSAASLSHPNIVSIYDVGQEGEIHYIVMEYIEGINLNDKIKGRGPLQVEEAIKISSQICDALDHAHHNRIIHRDIKPHNILIGKNGRIKVTDFGIARAAASTDITQTGSVIGSVHYFSPEHAKGTTQGEESDLYSLGIVLYQMVTGKLPFIGESPISVALKHLQEDMEEPRKINPLIPQSMENIIIKAMRKRPDQRYHSAKQMLDDLESCLLPEKRNEPKIAFLDNEGIDEGKTIVIPALRGNTLKSQLKIEDPRVSGNEHAWVELEEANKGGWLKIIVWAIVIMILLLLMWFGVSYVQKMLAPPPSVEVPSLVNLTLEAAVAKLEGLNLKAEPIEFVFHDEIAKNIVISNEKTGVTVREEATVKLVVSKGIELSVMPDYVGASWREIGSEIEARFPEEGQLTVKYVISDNIPADEIIEQLPEAEAEYNPKDVQVTIKISKGKGTFEMPNLINLKESVVESILEKNDLVLKDGKFVHEPSYTQKGLVFKQFPFLPGDQVEPGAEVSVYVSSGYPEDAIEFPKNVEVNPEVPGEKSAIRIMISDARSEDRVWGEREITETQSYPVTVILSKQTNAVITVYINEKRQDPIVVTYSAALEAQNPTETTEPVDPTPDPDPDAEPDPDQEVTE